MPNLETPRLKSIHPAWTKEVPTKEGFYLVQDPSEGMEMDRRIRCAWYCEYDLRVHPDFPRKGPWYAGPVTPPPATRLQWEADERK